MVTNTQNPYDDNDSAGGGSDGGGGSSGSGGSGGAATSFEERRKRRSKGDGLGQPPGGQEESHRVREERVLRLPIKMSRDGKTRIVANAHEIEPAFDPYNCETEHAWDPQKMEPSLWYTRFQDFLLQPPAKRSIMEAIRRFRARRRGERDSSTTRYATFDPRWTAISKQWCWQVRASLYDVYQAEEERREFEDARKESRKHRIKLAAEMATRLEEAMPRIKLDKLNGKDFAEVLRIVFNELRTDFNDMPTQRLAMIRVQAAREVAEELGINVEDVLAVMDEEGNRRVPQLPPTAAERDAAEQAALQKAATEGLDVPIEGEFTEVPAR